MTVDGRRAGLARGRPGGPLWARGGRVPLRARRTTAGWSHGRPGDSARMVDAQRPPADAEAMEDEDLTGDANEAGYRS